MTMSNKTWTIYGFFDNYDEAKEKINELNDKYDLYKIKRARETAKKGCFKLKVWKKPIEVKKKKKKRKSKKDDNQ